MKKKIAITVVGIMLIFSSFFTATSAQTNNVNEHVQSNDEPFKLGVEMLLENHLDLLEGKNVGLITNPTGVTQDLKSIVDVLYNHPDINLVSLYGPEHGIRGSAQAGEGVDFYIDPITGLPVYSLYGDTKKPTPEMLEGVDVLLFDIQDVGTRFYTYIYTMALAMEAAAENNIEFVVLDRPNPIGGTKVEGPVLNPDYASFVGKYPIPIRHGMTVGELAKLFNNEYGIGADLTVVEMNGWERSMQYDDTPLEWVLPSPNMPTLDTATVYPGAAWIEGTNVSEGRGTTRPFELIGAPYINSLELTDELDALDLPGVTFRAASFTPLYSKHAGELVHGIQIHVTDRETYKPVKTGLAIVKKIHDLYPDDFEFRAENSNGVSFFDLLVGNGWIREMINQGASIEEIVGRWQEDLQEFKEIRRDYLLYKVTATEIKTLVKQLEKEDEINADTARALKMHLTAVIRYEVNGLEEKVVKHMEGFKVLLKHHKENEMISKEVYEHLTAEANSMIEQWQ